jgi:hypothetical protein
VDASRAVFYNFARLMADRKDPSKSNDKDKIKGKKVCSIDIANVFLFVSSLLAQEEEEEDDGELEPGSKRLKIEGKQLISITVPNSTVSIFVSSHLAPCLQTLDHLNLQLPMGISELQENTLKQCIRDGSNMYKAKFPTLIDLSHPQCVSSTPPQGNGLK